jgi:hypothetical protein
MRTPFYCLIIVAMALGVSVVPLRAQQERTPGGVQTHALPYPRPGVLKLGENDRVVAWEVLRDKGVASEVYRLPLDQVVITLTEGAVKFTTADGVSRITQEKFGAVRYEAKGTIQREEGLNEIPSRAIVFQLKDAASRPVPVVDGIPGQFPRINAVKLFETDRIKVWDQVWIENQTITNHLHYTQTVAVFLTGGKLLTRDLGKPSNPPFERHQGELLGVPAPRPGGSPSADSGAGAGGQAAAPPARMTPHEEEWAGGAPRAIWIEFK